MGESISKGEAMTVHLHWLRNPKEIKQLASGIALCGQRNLPREELTAFVADTDCEECLKRAERADRVNKRGPRPKLNNSAKWRE